VEAILISIGLLMIVATLLPLAKLDDWWIRIFDFPRLQITVMLALTFVGYLFVREDASVPENIFLAVLAACLVYQIYRMYPYTPLHRRQVQPSRQATPDSTISLLFSNVLMSNRDAEPLRRLIREQEPDVILAVEADAWWETQLAELERTHTYTVKQAQDNTYGMLLYSRLELRNAAVKFLVQDDVPSIHACLNLRSGQQVQLRCLHPRPPAPQENDRSTERDAELLIVGREIKGKSAPAIVLGDLNDVAWSRTNDLFQVISGLLDPRIGRGFFHTFNANWPLIRFPLDHVFHSRHFRLAEFRRLRHCGSDHFPVYARLSFEPDAEFAQEHPQATQEEKQEAQEKIEEVNS
jgi:endonuclease/exonuclease/phosphatase (EEP) superfamily protein YafD